MTNISLGFRRLKSSRRVLESSIIHKVQTHSKLVQICPNSKLISKLAQTCPKSVGSCGFRYVVLSWSGLVRTRRLFSKNYYFTKTYILYSESFTITGDVFPKSFGQFTLLYYCNKLFKTKIDLQLSGILLHKVHSTNEILWNKIPVLIL